MKNVLRAIKTKLFLFPLKIKYYSKYKFHLIIKGDIRRVKIGKGAWIDGKVIFYVYSGYIEIGENCEIHHGVILNASGGKIIIGNESSLNPYCVVYGDGNTIIGDGVRIAAHTVIVSANHNYVDKLVPIRKQGCSKKGIIIKDDVWIGAGVQVLDGVTINKGAVVGAGSVINSEVPEYALCVGVPAKVIKFRK
jgi:acetyltransferase-like isoleucine patch superfamily enzyme